MEKNSRILITGHKGLVGSAIVRELKRRNYTHIITIDKQRCDLRSYDNVYLAWESERFRPEYVINCAGTVGGIIANNTRSAEFIYDNLMIQANVINVSHKIGVKKLLQLGSSCIYPRECPQPIKEEYFLSGYLEETNKGYAIAKIAGITMCQMYRKQYNSNFISVMPTNLYGENDNFNLPQAHVLPTMIRKIYETKRKNDEQVIFDGSGLTKREFMYVDDLVDAIIFLMDNYNDSTPINVGTGEDMLILEVAEMIAKVAGYQGDILFTNKQPAGTPRKILDVSKIHSLGWHHKTSLMGGLSRTYEWFKKNYNMARL